jgi:tetratricopeptide (TPR) repeat protein
MIEAALDAWQAERTGVRPRRWRWPAVAVAASLLLGLAGGASAARWYFGRAEPRPEVTPLSTPKPRAPRPKVRAEGALARPTELPALTVEAEPPDVDGAEGGVVARMARAAPPHEKSEPDDLLQRANRLRAEGSFRAAADTYAQVFDRYPRSLSAYAAQVAAASIALEHLDKPEQARRLFDGALRAHPHGALDLEARQGLCLALRELGRSAEEARSLRALIQEHRGSPAARRAAARLAALLTAP